MEAHGPENVSHALNQAEASSANISQQLNNPAAGVESQLHGVSDIASARNFFVPKVDMQAMVASVPGLENSATAAGAAAAKAASGAISPMLQIIMRLPGHLGVFNSFLDVLKSLFMPHDLLSNFHPSVFVPGVDFTHVNGLTHISQSLAHPHAFDLSMLPSQAFQNMGADLINSSGIPHLHVNAFDSLKQSMNVSAGVDLNNPQFEGTTVAHQAGNSIAGQFSAKGDSLAGPSLSAQAVTPKLAPAERVFSTKFFESSSGHSNANSLLASNNQSTASSISNSSTSTNQITTDPDVVKSSAPAMEHSTSHSYSGLSGLQAKALSLNDVLHNKHFPSTALPKHMENNPFSKLASNTRQAFQTSQSMQGASHQVFSHGEPTSIVGHSAVGHGSLSNQYTVKSGDTLWRISKNVLGSGDKWAQLYQANSGTVGANPNMIFSGQKLNLSGFDVNQTSHMQTQLAHHMTPAHTQHVEQHLASNHVTPAHSQHVEQHLASNHVTPAHSQHVEQHLASNHITPAHSQHIEQHLASNHVTPAHSQHVEQHLASNHVTPTHTQHIDEHLASHPQSTHNSGLAVGNAPDHMLSGSGGAQAATSMPSTLNKAAAPAASNQSKSVVSFSLTPDLSFLDTK